jgi:uncharacterized protein YndB with AHSA1/START domain
VVITFEDEIEIRRPVADVFAFVSDHEHLPAWQLGVKRVKRTTPLPIGVGTTYTVVGRAVGRRLESTYELTAYEPDGTFSGRMTSRMFAVEETYRFSGDGSRTTLHLRSQTEPRGAMRLLGPAFAMAVQRQVKADHRRLKVILEKRARKPASKADRG